MGAFVAALRRDLLLAMRRRQEVWWPVWFAGLVVLLFPLGLEPTPEILRKVAPGVVWIAILLAGLLTLDPLFRGDAEDGTLEQWLLGDLPLPLLAFARIVSHWAVSALPLLLLSPLLALLMGMQPAPLAALVQSVALGGPVLSALGAIGASLALGARRGGFLVSLLVLPWYIPVLIFATLAVGRAEAGLAHAPLLMLLGALTLLSLTLAPFAVAGALRINLSA